MSFQLRQMPLSELKPAPYHPRRVLGPKSPAYRKLRASLSAFGLVEPLVWNEVTGHLVGGCQRLRVLGELGFAEVPVAAVRLSEPREKALNVVLNNTRAQGRFDVARLEPLLTEPGALFELTGFDRGVLASLRMEPATAPPQERPSDRVEVTLVADAAQFARLSATLDKLIGDHGLVAHVRRRVSVISVGGF